MTRFLFHVENKLEVILPTRENGYFHSAPVAKKEREGIWMIPQWLQGGLMGSVGSGILCVIQAMWPKAPNFTSPIYTCLVCVIRRFTYMVMKRPWHILVKNRCWWVCIMEQDGLNSESDYERLWMPSKKVGPFAAESGDPWKSLNREVTRTSQCIKEVALPTVHDRWMKMRSRGRGTFQEAITKTLGFLDGSVGKEFACGTGDTRGFNPWVGKIPWSKKWQLTPVFLPGKFLWQRSPAGYSPWGQSKETWLSTWHMTWAKTLVGGLVSGPWPWGWTGRARFWNIGEVPQPPPLSLAPKIPAKEDRKVWILASSFLSGQVTWSLSLSSLIGCKGMITYLARVVKIGEKVCNMSSMCLAWSKSSKDSS